ncbi:MAG: GNAT family N-acetyltransferase [Clostridia bacterium]|nr:GNAT family N-acetyltransferase [Clostridia bacterium]MBR2287878.1 GNAT family N-acetyltransferase [Clostridia bacterium]
MLQNEILSVARRQSAEDVGCSADDFQRPTPVVCPYAPGPGRRRYYSDPIAATLISYGTGLVASGQEAYLPLLRRYTHEVTWYHAFETPALHALDDAFAPYGQRVCFMAEYWLPDVRILRDLPLPQGLTLRTLTAPDFAALYLPEWGNALCADRKELDVLGLGAYSGDTLVGFAACSADCDSMWQIGVDVLPDFRRRGLASCLTSRLAGMILERGRVPFYCCAWSNLPSARNAIAAGFRPAWAEVTVKPAAFTQSLMPSMENREPTVFLPQSTGDPN